MNNTTTARRRLCAALPLLLALQGAFAASSIVRDGSIGSGPTTALAPAGNVLRNGVNYQLIAIPESYGRRAGGNVFQSFSRFDLGSGDAALFTLAAAAQNLIARVTGGTVSSINGLLGIDPGSTGSAPNFYFINPAGVTFGDGAALDVPAAFHVSTADYLKFPDGRLYADTTNASTFSSAAPEAFGFLGAARATVNILDGAVLASAGQAMDIVAGDVHMDNGVIASDGGDVRVVALGRPGAREVALGGAVGGAEGSLSMSNFSVIEASSLSGNQGGNIEVSAGTAALEQSQITSSALEGSDGDAGSVHVQIAGELVIADGSRIASDTYSWGNAGAVTVTAGSLRIEGGSAGFAAISSDSTDAGNAGPVTVTVSGDMQVLDRGKVSSDTYAGGAAGSVSVRAGSLSIDGGDVGLSYISSDSLGFGDAGAVSVVVSGAMSMSNTATVSSDTYSFGNAGSVTVSAGTLVMDTDAKVSSDARSDGDGGVVDVAVTGDLIMTNRANITSNAQAFGNAGNVLVRAGSLVLDAESHISSDSSGQGDAGTVDVRVDGALAVSGNSAISSNDTSDGRAGNVSVRAGSLSLDGSNILSEATGAGDAGSIYVEVAGDMRLVAGSVVSSNTYSVGTGGDVTVLAGSLTLDERSKISSDARGDGNAGSVSVQVDGAMSVLNGSQVSSDTYSFGDAGNVSVRAGSLVVDGGGTFTYVSSDAVGGGEAGSVTVDVAGAMRVANGGSVSSDTYSIGNAGNVTVWAGSLEVDGGDSFAYISSDALGGGNAGIVSAHADTAMSVLRGATVSSDTRSFGRAGDVYVSADTLSVSGAGSAISSKAYSGSSGQTGTLGIAVRGSVALADGGTLSIANDAEVDDPSLLTPSVIGLRAPVVTLKNASITAASTGNVSASSIYLEVGQMLWLDPSSISTSANLGNGGAIVINAPNAVVVLDNSQITTSVSGLSGNGGDIAIDAKGLVMNTGFIQANTAAPDASGGNVGINVQMLVPSGNSLFVGGDTPFSFEPFQFGLNVIQAAAPTGVSGQIDVTAPVLDISGSLTGLSVRAIDTGELGRSPCRPGAGSSFVQGGRGGFPPSARGLLGAAAPPDAGPPPGAALPMQPLPLAAIFARGCRG
ncbi:MAG: filamentous hemagglutinin N-terminal domain-containing protein [Rhodocyclaceae bacterium]|nr:filamentous hemagglutinin N-terminal domain-containing protein [Rhodocyclaceae bacterium]MBX3669891.1 filamentous hemagglutinin N-terminal domain-containing protein [Rhodocyclaceae bacterium]